MIGVVKDSKGRTVIKAAVTGKGKEALTEVSERYGMKEYIVAGRVFEWFLRQDDIFQRAVLRLLEGLEIDAAAKFMERWGKGEAKIPDFLASGEYGEDGGKAKKGSHPPAPRQPREQGERK